MPLLNYTTTVAASRTAAQITELLAKHGASQILAEFGPPQGRVIGMSFAIDTDAGMMRYRLPIDIDAVNQVMLRDRQIPRRFKTMEQAERVAWRIMKDWLEAQLAIIATRMVSLDQVMLPYMLMPEGTVYEVFKAQRLTAIGTGAA